MKVNSESIPKLVRQARESSRLSKVDFARAAGTTRAAVDEYEKGVRIPRVDSLVQLLEPSGLLLEVRARPTSPSDPAGSSLASFISSVDLADPQWTWRTLIGDFVANEFAPALSGERRHLIAQRPASTGSQEWDSFVGALAEHLSFHARIDPPMWVFAPDRGALDHFWWPVHGSLPVMRSAALGLTPAAFRRRCIAIDGRELPYIAP